jgi:hypothetical protein
MLKPPTSTNVSPFLLPGSLIRADLAAQPRAVRPTFHPTLRAAEHAAVFPAHRRSIAATDRLADRSAFCQSVKAAHQSAQCPADSAAVSAADTNANPAAV